MVKRDVVEIMLDTLEYYSRDLERQIAAKKVEYERERQRADDINFMIGLKFILSQNILLAKARSKDFCPHRLLKT